MGKNRSNWGQGGGFEEKRSRAQKRSERRGRNEIGVLL